MAFVLINYQIDYYVLHQKRSHNLKNWKWDEVIDISDDEDPGISDAEVYIVHKI